MVWLIYITTLLLMTGALSLHLRRFSAAYTEMLGMMAGMAMGMISGFALGYAAALATNSMFWGNLFGILFGVIIGMYFGLPAGLMGAMDGGMAGFMAGSMGAMLAVMIRYPEWAVWWTAVLLTVLYLGAAAMLVALVERRAPTAAARYWLRPWFGPAPAPAPTADQALPAAPSTSNLINYYEMFDIPVKAGSAEIAAAYLRYLATADARGGQVAAEALAALTNSAARARYDQKLALASGKGECCAPPRRSVPGTAVHAATAPLLAGQTTPAAAVATPVPAAAGAPPRPRPAAPARPPVRPVTPPAASRTGTRPVVAPSPLTARAPSAAAPGTKKSGGSQAPATRGPAAQRASRSGHRGRQYAGGQSPQWGPAAILGGAFVTGLLLIGLILSAKDHVHLFVSIPPQVTISRLVQRLKGKSAYKLLQEYPHLRKKFWGQHLWARGYFCCSSGNVTDEVIKAYIADQKLDTDLDFRVDGEETE